ncbi:MAG: LPS export ABC transporter periplasmic protein LptC [Gammaproteobacteria bacterium]|nr:LPS export ABC transporter periplasmic protein LptC [Gammaproteobacteria bacterium]
MNSVGYVLALLLLAFMSGWLFFTVESTLHGTGPQGNQAPTLYVDNFQAVSTDDQGLRQYTLAAPHLIQLPGQQGTRIAQPRFEALRDGQIREWLVQAQKGWLAADKETLRLDEGVTLTRPAESGEQPVTITTEHVLVYPKQGLAETDAAVHAQTPGGVLDATGLRAYWNEERVELLSAVRSVYAPPRP